jgi:hypothetical protein
MVIYRRQLRQTIKKTTYRLRSRGKCAKMVIQQRRAKFKASSLFLLYTLIRNGENHRLSRLVLLAAGYYEQKYRKLRTVVHGYSRWRGNRNLSFDSLDRHQCWHLLRFKKKHLWKVSQKLLLPREKILDNGSWTNNQEMLIILLARLSTASKGSWIKLEVEYGVEYSRMSRIFKVR